MVSSGKGDVGVSKLTGEVLEIMEKMPNVVEKLTGINIQKVRLTFSFSLLKTYTCTAKPSFRLRKNGLISE